MSGPKYCLARPIEGVSINGKEHLLDDKGEVLLFPDRNECVAFAAKHGIPEDCVEEWVERDPLTGAQLADLEGPEQVHCLKCDHAYLEAEVCPKCGNTDKQETVYLMPESRFKS